MKKNKIKLKKKSKKDLMLLKKKNKKFKRIRENNYKLNIQRNSKNWQKRKQIKKNCNNN